VLASGRGGGLILVAPASLPAILFAPIPFKKLGRMPVLPMHWWQHARFRCDYPATISALHSRCG
jgi:hypothetical protein